MGCNYLLLELALRPRNESAISSGAPTSSTGYRLAGAYAVELDKEGRRHRSHRFMLRGTEPAPNDLPGSDGGPATSAPVELFENEAALLARVLAQIEECDCLVTSRGRQLEVPVLEALALRHGITLRGHFPLEEPYAARRSPYNPAGHLDLSFFLADGDRRLRSISPELLLPLAFHQIPRQLPRNLMSDGLGQARARALTTYLLFLRVQEMRGRLAGAEVAQRKAELHAGLSSQEIELVQQSESVLQAAGAPTWLDQTAQGYLAFDIETALDTEALGRSVGRKVGPAEAPAALAEILGSPTEFAPAPYHRVVALAMVYWDGADLVEIESLVLGGATRLGAPLSDESALLTAFWRIGRNKQLLSYNGKRFDLPVLLYRSLPYPIDCGWYLEEKRPAYEQYRHPQSIRQLDVFEQLSGGLSPGRLGDLLQTVGLPGKQGTMGKDVEDLWAQQALATIGDYCLSDAAQTFLLALRFMSISGRLERAQAGAAIALARSRFEREPALSKMLEGASREFFSES
jgi:3'-5' exonuclease